MSKIENGGLDQYDAEPFEQQQFGPAGVEKVNNHRSTLIWPVRLKETEHMSNNCLFSPD